MKKPAIKDRIEFKKILKENGFTPVPECPLSFSNEKKGRFADILDMGNYCEVWAVGKGLKSSSGFPGGWLYTPESLKEALKK